MGLARGLNFLVLTQRIMASGQDKNVRKKKQKKKKTEQTKLIQIYQSQWTGVTF